MHVLCKGEAGGVNEEEDTCMCHMRRRIHACARLRKGEAGGVSETGS